MDNQKPLRSRKELELRKSLCEGIIKKLKEIADDPRQPAALAEYEKQLESINAQLQSLDKPAPTVVKLKTAVLFPRVEQGE